MYISTTNHSRTRGKRTLVGFYQPENVQRILSAVEADTDDHSLRQSLHFSTGVVDRLERQFTMGCSIIADSNLVYSGIDQTAFDRLPVRLDCFIDDPRIVALASQRRITRAEVALEQALTVEGSKLIVIGSAPMALNRLLQLNAFAPLHEVVVLAAATGFASSVELKERLWESGLPCIVVRGRKGGASTAISITNALLRDVLNQQ